MRPFAEFEDGEWSLVLWMTCSRGSDDSDGVHVVEEADVGYAEELALHLPAVGDDGGVDWDLSPLTRVPESVRFGSDDCGCGCCLAPLGAKSLKPSAVAAARGHGGAGFGVVYYFLRPSARSPLGFSAVAVAAM
jgi:hypothetical protein